MPSWGFLYRPILLLFCYFFLIFPCFIIGIICNWKRIFRGFSLTVPLKSEDIVGLYKFPAAWTCQTFTAAFFFINLSKPFSAIFQQSCELFIPLDLDIFTNVNVAAVCNEANHLAAPSIMWNNSASFVWILLIQKWMSHEIKVWIAVGLSASLPPSFFRNFLGIRSLVKNFIMLARSHNLFLSILLLLSYERSSLCLS